MIVKPEPPEVSLQDRMERIQHTIFDSDYYSQRYIYVLNQLKMTPEGVEKKEYSDKQIILLAHYFWDALPDSPAIRVQPFYDICNIAEGVFDLEEEDHDTGRTGQSPS